MLIKLWNHLCFSHSQSAPPTPPPEYKRNKVKCTRDSFHEVPTTRTRQHPPGSQDHARWALLYSDAPPESSRVSRRLSSAGKPTWIQIGSLRWKHVGQDRADDSNEPWRHEWRILRGHQPVREERVCGVGLLADYTYLLKASGTQQYYKVVVF